MCRRHVVRALPLFGVAAVLSCRGRDRVVSDSAAETARAVTTLDDAVNWPRELGPLLVVPSDSENTGVVLFPGAPSPNLISSGPLSLLSASGDSTRARASLALSDSQVCGEAPTIRFHGDPANAWSVALLAHSATLLRMDSIETLPAADSARLAADLARLASAIPVTRESRFSGLPFVVLSAQWFVVMGRQTAVAHLVRRLPQEASPLEEHTLVIAERAVATPEVPYALVHHRRSDGTEETVDHYEVLSAVQAGGITLLVLSREQDAQTVYEILERHTSASWRVRWERTLAC